MRGSRFILMIALALGVLVGAGCGSSTGKSTPREQKPADLRLARALVPVTSDFPAGWTLDKYQVRANDRGEGCPIDHTGLVETAHVRGAYQHGDHPAVIGAATTYQTPDQAMTAYRRSTHVQIRCMARTFEQAARGAEENHRHVTDFRLATRGLPTVGDRSARFHMVLSWDIYGTTMSNHIDVLFFRVDRSVGVLLALDENAPFDEQLLGDLARTVTRRGQAAA